LSQYLPLIRELVKPIVDKASHPKNIFQIIASIIYPSIEKTMEEEELFSHDYILQKMQKQIQNETFLKKVQEKYQGVIVDEFQDTDPVQWQIFETLFVKKRNLEAFYLVGDPKQSIYGFRKADLATYFHAEKTLGSLAKGHLNQNFRSTPSLVNSLNYFFSEPFATHWLKLPKEQKIFSYSPVQAGLKEDFSFEDTHSPVHFVLTEGSLSGKKWPSDEIKERTLFPFIVSEIQNLHIKSGIPLSNMSVLVKDRYEQNALQNYFLLYSIPFSSKEHSLLTESSAFYSLEELFQGIFCCQDTSKVKKAFLGHFWEGDPSEFSDKIFLQFFEWKNLILCKGITLFFEEFFSFTWKGRSLLERLIQKEDFSLYQDTQKIKDLLLEFMYEKKRKPEEILTFFEELSKKDPEEHEEIKKSFSSEKEGVQIVTMHMSKGLEFDIVFALGVGTRTPIAEEREENDREKLRQLYVALTRAKKRVYIPLAIDNRKKGCEKGALSPLELFLSEVLYPGQNPYETVVDFTLEKMISLLDKKPFFSVEIVSEKVVTLELKTKNPLSLKAPEKLRPIDGKEGTISSFSTMLHTTEKKGTLSKKIEIRPGEKILPLGAETGIFFHFLFETIFKSGDCYEEKVIENIIKKTAVIYSFEDFEEDIKKIVFATFSAPLLPHGFCLKDLNFQKIQTEVNFFFEEKKDFFLKGSIDLIFFHEGKYYLLDWKTNYIQDCLRSSTKEKIEALMKADSYFLQASIYTEALSRLLGSSFDSFGGMFYIFLREMEKGDGIFHFIPKRFSSNHNLQRE
jgi:exodeoxyribonuclease V beta subunit